MFCLLHTGDPYRMNYQILYTLENLRCYFPNDVIRAVHIGIEVALPRGAVESTLDPLAAKGRGFFSTGVILR